jgi:hypothetical protein
MLLCQWLSVCCWKQRKRCRWVLADMVYMLLP